MTDSAMKNHLSAAAEQILSKLGDKELPENLNSVPVAPEYTICHKYRRVSVAAIIFAKIRLSLFPPKVQSRVKKHEI